MWPVMSRRLGTALILCLGTLWACGMGGLHQPSHANNEIKDAQDPVDVIWFPNPPLSLIHI